ncbi:hypothetical protein [Candidatus Brocadia sapporoensis]|uniref:hypothetical protein n=1 Tax=Candidatus Brocadia sapporoensis TaxID=392547 RepID=UPI0011786195|nr:hypothetical protein [Candidatus Brocadia sapporoensis]
MMDASVFVHPSMPVHYPQAKSGREAARAISLMPNPYCNTGRTVEHSRRRPSWSAVMPHRSPAAAFVTLSGLQTPTGLIWNYGYT